MESQLIDKHQTGCKNAVTSSWWFLTKSSDKKRRIHHKEFGGSGDLNCHSKSFLESYLHTYLVPKHWKTRAKNNIKAYVATEFTERRVPNKT